MSVGIDGRDGVTQGRGPIVLRVQNGYTFHEHATVGDAVLEATRLAERVGGAFVVLVPVAIVRPAPRTVTTTVDVPDLARYLEEQDTEYPF